MTTDSVAPGRFTFHLGRDQWEWDDEVYRLHGLPPGSVEPSLELIITAVDPADRERVEATWSTASQTAGPLSTTYRLLAADQVTRHVALVGEAALCDPDDVMLIQGYYLDLTADFQEEKAAAVEASAESRAAIEQAKGALMVVYGVDADAAFAMLRWWSRNRNVKVRELAQQLADAVSTADVASPRMRSTIDALLHDLTSTA